MLTFAPEAGQGSLLNHLCQINYSVDADQLAIGQASWPVIDLALMQNRNEACCYSPFPVNLKLFSYVYEAC